MKKVFVTLLTLISPLSLYALPVGNPWDASLLTTGVICEGHCAEFCDPNVSWCDAWSLRVGFYGDYVFNRHMEVDRNDDDSSISKVELYTNAAYLALNFYDRFDIFATLGTTNIQLRPQSSAFGDTFRNTPALVATETDFSWSLGVRATLWECGCLGIGAEAQYFETHPKLNFYTDDFLNEPEYFHEGDRLIYQEWQIGFGVAYRVNISCSATALVPYAAVKWGRALIDMDDVRVRVSQELPVTLFDLETEREWGYAIGLTLVGCDKAGVTVEGRWASEKAVHVNAQFRY